MSHEPKKRHSRQRQGKRRASIKLGLAKFIICPNCQAKHAAHIVCPECGYYKGSQVVVKKSKTSLTQTA